jgi:hypothetical protein
MNASRRSFRVLAAVAGLLLALFLQLTLAASRNSASFDEPAHIYAGYLQWAHGWYTLNPPVTRYLIAAPLLDMKLKEPPILPLSIRAHEMLGGKEFVFRNDAETILFRSRMAVVTLALLLAVLVFLATRRMFGVGAGVIALGLLAFDPTLLAHSSVATTDTGQALFMFWAIYAFYRYVKQPTAWRLVAVSVVVGLAIAAKASAVQLFPMLGLLVLVELVWGRKMGTERPNEPTGRQVIRFTVAFAVIAAVSFAILWASYGFRYVPADGGVPLVPSMAEKLAQVPSARAAKVLGAVDRLHLLPQAFTYGFAHTLYESKAFTTYVLGTVYPGPVWSFFPVSMAIKSSLTFLILLALGAWAVFRGKVRERRGILYMVTPAALYLAIAIAGGMNIGVRHVLPVYVFLTAAIGGAAWALIQQSRRWLYVVVVLLVFQAASVLHSFPAYIAYGNEAFGGPANVHKYLSDSNADWGQQLKAVKRYIDARGIRDCWIAYFAQGPLDYRDYGISCKPLVTAVSMYFPPPADVPPAIDGTVFVSACTLSGFEFGPPPLAPYEDFKSLKPTDVIDYGVFVFQGHFEIPQIAALSHVQKAGFSLRANDPQAALAEARQAEALDPGSSRVLATVAQAFDANQEPEKAVEYYRKALAVAQATHPEFQAGAIAALERRLGGKQN